MLKNLRVLKSPGRMRQAILPWPVETFKSETKTRTENFVEHVFFTVNLS